MKMRTNPDLTLRHCHSLSHFVLHCRSLGVPVTDHTYEDIRLMNYSSLIDFPSASILVEFSKLSYKLG